jgi:hypothetical protein
MYADGSTYVLFEGVGSVVAHDDGTITFPEGTTAEDYGDAIRLNFRNGVWMMVSSESRIIFRDGRDEPQIPYVRRSLAAAGVPTTRS